MPTAEQVEEWADDFEKSYPDSLPDRLRWFHQELKVDRDRLLRLIGVPADKLEGHHDDLWDWAVDSYPDGAAWAEEMLLQTITFFDYNWRALQDCIRQPLGEQFRVHQQGGEVVQLKELATAEQDKVLLSLIGEGGEKAVHPLVVFLSLPFPKE
jgi:hypothetical protein